MLESRLPPAVAWRPRPPAARPASPDNPRWADDTFPTAMVDLPELQLGQGRLAPAVELAEPAFRVLRGRRRASDPEALALQTILASAYQGLGRADDAVAMRRQKLVGLQLAATSTQVTPGLLNDLAWGLLTDPSDELRDPEKALGYAKRACEMAESAKDPQSWRYLDTRALAQFRTGDPGGAAATSKRAIELGSEHADDSMRRRLAEHQAGARKQGGSR